MNAGGSKIQLQSFKEKDKACFHAMNFIPPEHFKTGRRNGSFYKKALLIHCNGANRQIVEGKMFNYFKSN